MKNYTRTELIKICEQCPVIVTEWSNRDTPEAQLQTGKLLFLLKAKCEFEILTKGSLVTDGNTIWINVYYPTFNSFENGFDLKNKEDLECETFYLPTPRKLREAKGKDWY